VITPEVIARCRAIDEIARERRRQDAKWGEQNHDMITWCAILTEEVGELAQCALQEKFGGEHGTAERLRNEAVQVAAVAIAIVECLERRAATT
jgi:NTP pyrophosphatase (non-canonical NTP hydrolase)